MVGRREVFLIALAWPLLLGSLANGQGYGNLDDDSGNFGGQQQGQGQIPSNQQTNNLPQYENPEQPQQQQVPQGNSAPQPQGQSNSPQSMWWQGQNAFQRPPGHPGVQPLGSASNAPSQAPQRPSFNAQGSGSGWQGPQQQQQQQPSQPAPQYQNAPSQQYNNPSPTSQGPNPQQYNPAGNGQQPSQQGAPQYNPDPQQAPPQYNNPAPQQAPPQYNNPAPQQGAPQYNNQGPQQAPPQYNNPSPQQAPPQYNNQQGGWNSPAPQQQYQPQGQGESAPGCELVNKADCHKRGNYNAQPPPQNYQPPPIDPQPYPEQPPYSPPQQQQSVPQPNLGYQPPPQQEPDNYLPQPSYNPGPSSPPQPQPYQPPPQSAPQPQRPPTQPSPQPQRPPTQPQPRPQPYQPPQAPRPRPAPQQNQRPPSSPAAPEEAPVPYPGCPAAMLCVQDDYCNMIGLIEENPVQLSAAEKLHRVALSECSEPMTGIVGKCCRDPNYVDPWPDMNGNGMPKKMMNGGGQHHPKTPAQGQKSPNFQPQQPPQGNHLAAGNGAANPYSGGGDGDRNGWSRNVQCNTNTGGGGASGYN